MAYEVGLVLAKAALGAAARTARTAAQAAADGKVTVFEGLALGGQAIVLVQTLSGIFTGLTAEERDELFYVLEHLDEILPDAL